MSDDSRPINPDGSPPLPPPLPPPRSGCLTGLMIVIGCILLLPGLCAALFSVSAIFSGHFDQVIGGSPIIILGLLVGFAGIMAIRAAGRGS